MNTQNTEIERVNKAYNFLLERRIILTQNEFTDKLGKPRSYVSEVFNKKRKLSEKFVIHICNIFPELNQSWLLMDEGEMLKSDNNLTLQTPNIDCVMIPLLPISAQGSSLNDFVVSISKNSDLEYVVSPINNVDLVMPVAGDSMAPEYPAGSYVYLKKFNERAFIEWGKVYVLDTCNGTVIKEIQQGDDDDHIFCYSINPNPKYKPFKIQFEDINGMYKVVLCMATK